jgi:DNA-binding transcriptional regulator YbjK
VFFVVHGMYESVQQRRELEPLLQQQQQQQQQQLEQLEHCSHSILSVVLVVLFVWLFVLFGCLVVCIIGCLCSKGVHSHHRGGCLQR